MMPRLARLDSPGVLHHVMGRGIERKRIFNNDEDRMDFIDRLGSIAEDGGMDIYAWSLMPNHFHLLCKTGNWPLPSNMRRLLTGYVVNFNKRHKRHGHLFQNRYKSIVVQEEAYLKELVRYIHLNLLRSKLVKDLHELGRSPWSGHSALMGKVKWPWQSCDYVLAYFGKRRNQRNNYQKFVMEGIEEGRRPELVGGGLVRSLGGWSEVIALRRKDERQASDQRILGDGNFVQEIVSDLDELVKKNLRLSGRRPDIVQISMRICDDMDISSKELQSGSRRAEIVKARHIVSWIGVKELGYSGAEVARFLGVTNSCVTRFYHWE